MEHLPGCIGMLTNMEFLLEIDIQPIQAVIEVQRKSFQDFFLCSARTIFVLRRKVGSKLTMVYLCRIIFQIELRRCLTR